MEKIIAIIVTYNGAEILPKCLDSLTASNFKVDIAVIDNNSKDTSALLCQNRTNIRLFKQTSNLGFGRANNIILRLAIKEGYSHALLINQDAWVEPDTITKLIDAIRKSPNYGILSPLHLDPNNESLDPNFLKNVRRCSSDRFLTDASMSNLASSNVYQIEFIPAAIWLISIEIIKRIGIFDPIFPHYGEDNDLCHRLNHHGFKVGIVPSSKAYHARISTSDPVIGARKKITQRALRHYINSLIYLKNLQKKYLVLFLCNLLGQMKLVFRYALNCNSIDMFGCIRAMYLTLFNARKIYLSRRVSSKPDIGAFI
jgi:GT2 family glycosyltransferase